MAENNSTKNKYVSPSKLSLFLENLRTIFAPLVHTHKISEISDYTVDNVLSSTSTNPVQNKVLDAEFQAISDALQVYDAALDDKVDKASIVDNLTTATIDQPLSANQGVALQNQITVINNKLADLMYEAITISSFTHNVGTKERGSTVTDVTLSWKTNKTPTTLSLDGELLDVNTTSKTFSGLSITWDNNKTWKLDVTDDREATATKSVSITFCNNIYYGVGSVTNGFDNTFVTGLAKRLQTAKAYDFTVNPSAQYIYYAVPTRLGAVTFKVGGFEGGFEAPETVSVTNSSGYTENYYVYRSTNKITGSTTVDVT